MFWLPFAFCVKRLILFYFRLLVVSGVYIKPFFTRQFLFFVSLTIDAGLSIDKDVGFKK